MNKQTNVREERLLELTGQNNTAHGAGEGISMGASWPTALTRKQKIGNSRNQLDFFLFPFYLVCAPSP